MKERTISVFNLTKNFKQYKKQPGLLGSVRSLFHRESYDIEAVKNISFDIEQGELVGFIGPNGAGKTTTLKCLSGLLYPTDGVVNVLGYTPWDRKRDFLKQISLVMGQKNQLWWDLPAIDSFLLNKEIYEIPEDVFRERLSKLVELLEIEDIIEVQVRKLSLGQRMKCELIAALLHAPKVLFLDEPTIGLDVLMQKKLRGFFKEFNQEFKTTIILTSHYMEDVKELCKRVIMIDKGELVYDGGLDKLVKKYATNKNISFVVTKKVNRSDLKKYGQIIEYSNHQVIISVPRDDISKVSTSILQSMPIEDLEIREMALDEVIRGVFGNGVPD
ncbi:ABC transporter ATP-binding protein [Candidatus Nomurabacteria bacterium]|uniref:ABC transporter ATP-binding protein n=1 Tax=Candidatus Dojkabacteria bacterium TaxID=2099670 RepID=A0A955I4A4_9BACT|nr:ABC transporter ATP-binding protein [Candidatus Dojkabacteria bacterium]MCB9789785.1 ABC transporter ATP-binding protein [Candidatus Nomurabacteria bacterium]MCB9803592.1 ABC transporter ATP-binding protein [Candidatus Nomurabacteria bacterium]